MAPVAAERQAAARASRAASFTCLDVSAAAYRSALARSRPWQPKVEVWKRLERWDGNLRWRGRFGTHPCTLTRAKISLYLSGMRFSLWLTACVLALGATGCDRLGPQSESEKGKLKIEHPGESPDTDRKGDVKGHPSAVGGGIIYDDGL